MLVVLSDSKVQSYTVFKEGVGSNCTFSPATEQSRVVCKSNINTPVTAGGPGGRDRTLAVAKNLAKMTFFSGGKKNYLKKIFFFCIYLLVMPKYWVTNYFAHWRFPEVSQKQKTEKEEKKKERKSESW